MDFVLNQSLINNNILLELLNKHCSFDYGVNSKIICLNFCVISVNNLSTLFEHLLMQMYNSYDICINQVVPKPFESVSHFFLRLPLSNKLGSFNFVS